ncbi:hypothetical protein glysoja_035948 [Glycine soja]|uniref:Uncharacterized protein n=1 Tax=Glycine soja TaxID=3848 RepID=A0A0B2PSE9_GLYSO|nr:hypothetical protein glysoja_035948 [Glycine soja]
MVVMMIHGYNPHLQFAFRLSHFLMVWPLQSFHRPWSPQLQLCIGLVSLQVNDNSTERSLNCFPQGNCHLVHNLAWHFMPRMLDADCWFLFRWMDFPALLTNLVRLLESQRFGNIGGVFKAVFGVLALEKRDVDYTFMAKFVAALMVREGIFHWDGENSMRIVLGRLMRMVIENQMHKANYVKRVLIGGLGGGSGGGGGRRVATETRDEDVDEAVEVVEQLRTHQHYQAQNDKIHFETPRGRKHQSGR